jgi:hypothetical protein
MQYQYCNLEFGMYEHPTAMFTNRLASHPKWHCMNHHVHSKIESKLNRINILVSLANPDYEGRGPLAIQYLSHGLDTSVIANSHCESILAPQGDGKCIGLPTWLCHGVHFRATLKADTNHVLVIVT